MSETAIEGLVPAHLLEILLCPVCCEGGILEAPEDLVCSSCGQHYPIRDGTARMLRPEMRRLLEDTGRPGVENTLADNHTGSVKARTARSFGFEWKQFHHLRAEWQRNFLEYMQPHGPEFFRSKRVLDAGCGSGRHAYYAATYGAEVVAVDLSEAIDVARANTRGVGCVETIQADLYNLPFAPESFDFIYSIGVLHHLPDPEGAFRNLLQYLKPGGEIQIYLYWWPEDQPVKRFLLKAVNALRRLTVLLPHRLLYWLSVSTRRTSPCIHRICDTAPEVLRSVPGLSALADRLPMKQYGQYPFLVCVNDQFDRFSAPIENRYTRKQVLAWLERAGLEDARSSTELGGLAWGRTQACCAGILNGQLKKGVRPPQKLWNLGSVGGGLVLPFQPGRSVRLRSGELDMLWYRRHSRFGSASRRP